MAIYKNVAGQKIAVFAYDPTAALSADPSKTGDAANITAGISKDGGANAATNDVNPTELDATNHPGIYIFDLTQAETNADLLVISAVSGTSNILLDPVQVLTADSNIVADAVLSRGASNVEATADKHSLCYVILAASESDTTTNADMLTVFQTDGTTEFTQKTLATAATVEHMTGIS